MTIKLEKGSFKFEFSIDVNMVAAIVMFFASN